MARTKSTARMSTGGKAPRKQLATTASRKLSRRENDKAFDAMKAAHMEAIREAKEKSVASEEESVASESDTHLEANEQEREELDEVMHLVREYKDEVWKKQPLTLQTSGMTFWDKIAELVEERREAISKAEQECNK